MSAEMSGDLRVLACVNPASGSVAPRGAAETRRDIEARLRDGGYACESVIGSALELKEAISHAMRGAPPALVVVAGGDGTIAATAGALADSGLALAPLPGGTMNLFVRDLGLPNDLNAALDLCLRGRRDKVDVAAFDGRVFVNNVAFGAYAALAEGREKMRAADATTEKIRAIAEIAYAAADGAPIGMRIELDGDVVDVESNFLMVANNLYTDADALRPTRARLDEGVLGAYVTHSRNAGDFFSRVAEALSGDLDASRDVDVRRAQRCRVVVDRDTVAAIDGDPVQIPRGEVALRILPKALTVLRP